MEKIYLISSEFDYSKMITYDAGPGYSNNMNWTYDRLENIHLYSEYVNIIDTRITEAECLRLEKYIIANKDTIFLLTITDPCREDCIDDWYYRLLFRIKNYKNVYFLSKYIPAEIVKDLDDSTKNRKMVFIPYAFVDRYNVSNDFSQRTKKIILSGALEKRLYPHRLKFYQYVRKSMNIWLRHKVAFLKHPDYPDIGRKQIHNIVGGKYIEYLSRFVFMFITPSRCDLELLKYTECAYAHCVPVGKVPTSFTVSMKESFIEIDFDHIKKSINDIFSVPISELLERSRKYYLAMSVDRNPSILNSRLDYFLESRGWI